MKHGYYEEKADDGLTQCFYYQGLKHGECRRFYPDGTPKFTGKYIMGTPVEDHVSCYPDGKKKLEISLDDDGLIHGDFTSYYKGGLAKKSFTAEHGLIVGNFFRWYRNGELHEHSWHSRDGRSKINLMFKHNGKIDSTRFRHNKVEYSRLPRFVPELCEGWKEMRIVDSYRSYDDEPPAKRMRR